MPFVVTLLRVDFRQGNELIAEINKRRRVVFSAKREVQELAVKFERFVDIAHFECNMIDANRARFLHLSHGNLLSLQCWPDKLLIEASSDFGHLFGPKLALLCCVKERLEHFLGIAAGA